MRPVLLALALGLSLVAATAALGAPPRAVVKLAGCSLAEHEATFYARMHAMEGTERMAMRFTLLERSGEEGFRHLRAPQPLRRWRWSKPGVRVFGFRQMVRNLPENATHRMRVEFRWYSSDGERLARVRRLSPPCRQFERLPNLTAALKAILPTSLAGVVRYRIRVSNGGRARAVNVPVRLTVDGGVVDTKVLHVLEPGELRTLTLRGPACASSARVEADPDRLIAETSEDDNSHELACG